MRKTFSHTNGYNSPIAGDHLDRWGQSNMYRTSYNDMAVKAPPINKNTIIPGYGGYVPNIICNGLVGNRKTKMAQTVFKARKYEEKDAMWSTTGFNAHKIPKQDFTMQAINHKYGSTTIPTTHPNIRPKTTTTTIRKSFHPPNDRARPTQRVYIPPRTSDVDFRATYTMRPLTRGVSGFVQNRTVFDGAGWVPTKNLHSDMFRTEYRGRFNTEKPFHKTVTPVNEMKMKKRLKVYDPLDA